MTSEIQEYKTADASAHKADDLDMIIVGAGVAGLYTLHRARTMGLSVRLYDAADGVGGTWYWNRYPGARVDIESVEYSYSFSEELQQEWSWTERYASQPELLRYLNHVADRFDLRRDIQLETRVESAVFDESLEKWIIHTSRGERVSAQFCVMATGCLSAPKKIDIKGIDAFQGSKYYTSRWPHESVDFTGKRVGIVGTGSSAIQSIPIIAKQAEHLTVFQRSANFSVPLRNQPIDPEYEKTVKESYADWRRRELDTFGGFVAVDGVPMEPNMKSALAATPEERQREYEFRWAAGGLCLYTSYADLLVSPEANDTLAAFVRAKLREKIDDPAVADILIPTGYPIMTKRLCADTNYYETYNRDNVILIDLKQSPIEEITSHGVLAGGVEHKLDALIFATGFDAVTGALSNIDIRGQKGVPLKQKWSHGPITYLGLMTSDFPNLFNVAGPGSTASLTSAIQCDEHQIGLVFECIQHVKKAKRTSIQPTVDAENTWTQHIHDTANKTLFPLANSWYVGANVPGKPRTVLLDLGGFNAYIKKCDEVMKNDFEGFVVA